MSIDTRRLTTELPVSVWDVIDAEARQQGMKIGTYVKHLLIEHAKPALIAAEEAAFESASPSTGPVKLPVADDVLTGKVPAPPTRAEWDAMNDWLRSTGKKPDLSREGITTKSGLIAWARAHGFED